MDLVSDMRIFSSPAWRVLLAGAVLPCAIQLACAGSGAAAVAAAHGPGPRAPVQTRLNTGHRAAPLPAGERAVCPAPSRPGQMQCMSIIRTAARGQAAGPAVTIRGYGPSGLRSAYKIASAAASGGRGRTIAIVDAFSDPRAGSDLAAYRAHYHLGACMKASGCLRIVNEHGNAGPLPAANRSWAAEESLDLDMVSAICPKCRILLVEASSASVSDLAIAENTAVAKAARYVSNSWSGGEFVGQDVFNHFFNHPGVAIDFASGDFGYGPAYPADLQYVTAVGGTTLRHSRTGRGWTEAVWGSATPRGAAGSGSGCSALEAKPSWQRADAAAPDGCLNRTENDVAADANPSTGVAVYDTYRISGSWHEFGGTSAATPIITAVYALAGTPASGSYPAEYPYLHAKRLFNVASGSNGTCETNRRYLCHGGNGYNGPTGLGTPNGTGAFTDQSARRVTLIDPGTQDRGAGTGFSLTIAGVDTSAAATTLSYQAVGLPPGLSIASVPDSTNGQITGTLPGPGTFDVTVTASDGAVAGSTRFSIVTVPSLTAAVPATGPVALPLGPGTGGFKCLDDNGGGTGTTAVLQPCGNPATQNWAYIPGGKPDGISELTIDSLCLAVSGSGTVLAACDPGSASQQWVYIGFGLVENPASARCMSAAPGLGDGTTIGVAACAGTRNQAWDLAAAPIITGAGADCLDNPNISVLGTQSDVAGCVTAEPAEQWSVESNGFIGQRFCLQVRGGSLLDGGTVDVDSCFVAGDLWLPTPNGELINTNSGRCLADPGNGPAGTKLVQEDCYGQAGEVWAIN